MLRDVRYSITDGQLQQPGQQGTGIHVKIGASPWTLQSRYLSRNDECGENQRKAGIKALWRMP